jgi:hypothetical protein
MNKTNLLVNKSIIEDNIKRCFTFNDLYKCINDLYNNLYNGIEFILVNKEYITFIANNKMINYTISNEFIDFPWSYPLNINIWVSIQYTDISNITKLLLNKQYNIISSNFKLYSQEFILFANANNKIIIDLTKYANQVFLNIDPIYYISLPNDINKDNLILKIEDISYDDYNLEKFLKCLFKFNNNLQMLNKIIENYNNVDILNDIRLQKNLNLFI